MPSDEADSATLLCARRRDLVNFAQESNRTLKALFRTDARRLGLNVLFYGNRRDAVRAVASTWVRGERSDLRSIPIDSTGVHATISPSGMEIDLDAASPSEIREIMDWLRGKVSTRNVLCSKHVVLIHGAERVPNKALAKLQGSRLVVLVLSTCSVDSNAIASLSTLVRVRVPAASASVPKCVYDALCPIRANPSVRAVRDAVEKCARGGFDVAEISRGAWAVFGFANFVGATCDERCRSFELLAILSHAAHGVSQLDRRALEALVLMMGLGAAAARPT